jgi:hypothetical protein
MSLCTFTTFYLLISKNIIRRDNLIKYLNDKGYNPQEAIDKYGNGKVSFALAYLCLFITKPLRLILTCVFAGFLSRVKAPIPTQNPINNSNPKSNKSILKQYGAKGFALYMSYWVLSGLFIYYLVVNKYINTDKVIDKIQGTMLERYYNKIKGSKSTDFAIAYLINACLEVVRLPTFLLFARYFLRKKRL